MQIKRAINLIVAFMLVMTASHSALSDGFLEIKNRSYPIFKPGDKNAEEVYATDCRLVFDRDSNDKGEFVVPLVGRVTSNYLANGSYQNFRLVCNMNGKELDVVCDQRGQHSFEIDDNVCLTAILYRKERGGRTLFDALVEIFSPNYAYQCVVGYRKQLVIQ